MVDSIKEKYKLEELKELYNNAQAVIENTLNNIAVLDKNTIKVLSSISKNAHRINNKSPIAQKINKTSYSLVHSALWEDLVHWNYVNILDYMYIARSAIKYSNGDRNKVEQGLRNIENIINGKYLLNTEWTYKNQIQVYYMCKELDIHIYNNIHKLIFLSNLYIGSKEIWKWTPRNLDTYMEYGVFLSEYFRDSNKISWVKEVANKLLVSAIHKKDISTTIDLLFLCSHLDVFHFDIFNSALSIIKDNYISESTAPSLLIISDYYVNKIEMGKEIENF
jgi:hypothetical protein